MITIFDTGEKIRLTATIKSAQLIKGKIYYKIEECDSLIPEEICSECHSVKAGSIKGKIDFDHKPLDSIRKEANALKMLIDEAMELADSIANSELNLRISAKFDDHTTELASITTGRL